MILTAFVLGPCAGDSALSGISVERLHNAARSPRRTNVPNHVPTDARISGPTGGYAA